MAHVELDQLTKSYGDETKPAVDEVSLEVGDGELLVLVGHAQFGRSREEHHGSCGYVLTGCGSTGRRAWSP